MNPLSRFAAAPSSALVTDDRAPSPPACSSSGSNQQSTTGVHPSRASPVAAQFPVTGGAPATARSRSRTGPAAIVSLSPTATEMLFAIGAGSQVKAVDKNSDYPASAPHTNLDAYQLNVEAVANYRPDLVVVSGLTAQADGAVQGAAHHGPRRAGGHRRCRHLRPARPARPGNRTPGAAAAEVSHDEAADRRDRRRPRPKPAGAKYYYELDQTYYSVTSATFIGQVLGLLGLHEHRRRREGRGGQRRLPAAVAPSSSSRPNPTYVFLADTKCCKQSPATVGQAAGLVDAGRGAATAGSSPSTTTSPRGGARASSTCCGRSPTRCSQHPVR